MDRSQFPLVEAVVAPSGTQPKGAHVVDFEIQKLLSLGWQRYVGLMQEVAGKIPDPAVKQITTSFEGECHGGEYLEIGVRALHRTRRSYVLEEAIWNCATGQLVASSRVVMTGIDRGTGRAAPVPENLWAAVEAFEGRSIEAVQRPT